MTTIAYRNGVMAADSGSWIGDASISGAQKVAAGHDGTLYGVSGVAGHCCNYLAWVESGCAGSEPMPEVRPDDGSSFIVLIAPPAGPLILRTAQGDEVYDTAYMSVGAGNVAALAAMFCGASAEQAIEAAIAHAPGAVGPVQSIVRR